MQIYPEGIHCSDEKKIEVRLKKKLLEKKGWEKRSGRKKSEIFLSLIQAIILMFVGGWDGGG